jgi:hypothetical protein
VVIPNSVTSIGPEAFEGNQLTRVVVSNRVTAIGKDAFFDNPLTSVTIGANLAITSSFGGEYYFFRNFYNKNGKKAGTYRKEGGQGGSLRYPSDPRNWKYYPSE